MYIIFQLFHILYIPSNLKCNRQAQLTTTLFAHYGVLVDVIVLLYSRNMLKTDRYRKRQRQRQRCDKDQKLNIKEWKKEVYCHKTTPLLPNHTIPCHAMPSNKKDKIIHIQFFPFCFVWEKIKFKHTL